jgi:arginyl-tRNA synthetase
LPPRAAGGGAPRFIVEIPADSKKRRPRHQRRSGIRPRAAYGAEKNREALVSHLGEAESLRRRSRRPGFLNVFYAPEWYADTVSAVLEEDADYGRSDIGAGKKIMVEFVSANPTGPMHMGNARGGAIGDGIAAALDACGYDVTREFYINDAGNQIAKFGCSLEARYLQIYLGEEAVEFPEDGYHGEDIKERAKEFADLYGDKYLESDPEERREALIAYALPKNVEGLQRDLAKYRIDYDVWFRESSLYKDGTVDKIVKILTDKGHTYEKDGALWYKNAQVLAESSPGEAKPRSRSRRWSSRTTF